MKESDWDLDGRAPPSTNGETWFWKSMWFKNKNLQCVFGQYDFDARIKMKSFSVESSSTTVELPIDLLMGQTKPVATQSIKFEYSVKSVSKSVSGILVQSGFWCKDYNRPLFLRVVCHNSFEIDWDLDWKNHTCSFGENWVWISS